jgi:lipid A 3-O-deacylase
MKAIACACALLMLYPHSAKAQEPAHNWDLSVWVAGSTGEELTNSFGEAQLWSVGFFIGRFVTPEIGTGWLRGKLEYGFDVIPLFVQWRPQLIYGGGFEPVVLHWNSALRISGAHPYVELAGGVLRTSANFPSGATSTFNFIAKGGGGLQVPLRSGEHLDVGVLWSHISNANLGVRNPEFNGIEIRLAYHWIK